MNDRRKSSGAAAHRPRATSSTATYVLAGIGIVVVAALVIGGFVFNSRTKDHGEVSETVLNENAALIIGEPTAPTTIDVFEDFLCPGCKRFEETSGQAIVDAVTVGRLRVRYHMLNFLNPRSASKTYSSRAAGALQCVGASKQPAVFFRFHRALFAQQPEENGDADHSDADLARIAAEHGAATPTQQCIAGAAMIADADGAAEESRNQLTKALDGPAVTPSVLLNGEPVEGILNGPGWLTKLLGPETN
ncbi:MAG: DsbA family protein [Gordonia sp. (in: high G+C Gram-positive bacteria)]